MDISEICKKWNNGEYTCETAIPKRVSEDHIFDEELSVRRNRELAKEHNQKVIELRTELQKQQNLLYQQLTDDVIKYIQENYNLNETQARKVERFVYQEYHSYMSDYFCYIDTFAEFASDLINMEN